MTEALVHLGAEAKLRSFCIFRPLAKTVESDYVFLYFKSATYHEDGIPRMTGTAGQKRVPSDYFSYSPFPLPPLAEQKRIVAKVDELMALCDEVEAAHQSRDGLQQKLRASALDALMNAPTDEALSSAWAFVRDQWDELCQRSEDVDELRQTLLQIGIRGRLISQDPTDEPAEELAEHINQIKQQLIEQKKIKKTKKKSSSEILEFPFELPHTWKWMQIEEFYDVGGGIQKTPKRAPQNNAFPYLRVANVQRGSLDLEEIEYFELEPGELEHRQLESGDLLVVEGNGSAKEIGRCAIWNGEIKNCVHQNHIIRVRPIGHTCQEFTLMFLNSPQGMQEMRNLAITTIAILSDL